MTHRFLISVFLMLYGTLAFGQTPALLPLDHNPALLNRKPVTLKSDVRVDTVSLPFMDDFSYYAWSSQPDRTMWMDRYVFINNNYPIQPRSNGVATFDALDADGNIYKNTSGTFPADTLTSCPIDLGESGLNDVYLSFFYQPQGYGDNPEPGDSLIVQFKSSITQMWHSVWNTQGTTVHPFKQVLLPVEGEEYLHKGFQFRFVNYVSLEQDNFNLGRKGNVDHWHVDYVRLDTIRHENKAAMTDIAMIAPIKSLIKGYQSIPWNQLQFAITNRIEPMIEMTYRNNDSIPLPVSEHYFQITDVYYNIVSEIVSGVHKDVEADEIIIFPQSIIYPFESTPVDLADSALFELKGFLKTNDDDMIKENDTVRFYQFFNNFFARDDGIPESGYGFRGYNAQGCAVACRYETLTSDTLQAIRMYFCPTENNVTAQYRFKIAVWRDDNGKPGEQVYLSSTEYSPKTTGQFTQFNLEKPLVFTKYYWIGWEQVTSGFLNVGFDRNYNDKGNLWYNTGTWQQDINEGTLMVRPVFGKKKDFPTSSELFLSVANARMNVYPNPASQYIRIELENGTAIVSSDYYVEIYDVTGRLHYRAPYTGEQVEVSGFEPGLYIVRLIHRRSGSAQTQKIVVNR